MFGITTSREKAGAQSKFRSPYKSVMVKTTTKVAEDAYGDLSPIANPFTLVPN